MSTNIAIHGQGTGTLSTSGNALIIARTFPGILSNKMSEGEWISFCNEVDKTLAPVGPTNGQIMGKMKMLACGMFAVIAGITGILIWGLPTISVRVVSFYIIPVVFFSLSLGLFCFKDLAFSSETVELNKCMKDLEEACERESARRHDVSFHVGGQTIGVIRSTRRNTRRGVRQIICIECSVGGAGGAGAGAVGNNNMTLSAMEAGQATPVAFPVGGPDINAPLAASSIFNNLAWGGSAQPTAPSVPAM